MLLTDYGIEIKFPIPRHYVYCITNNVNGFKYVGQTKEIKKRIENHLQGQGSKGLLKDIVRQGIAEFTFEVLEMLYTDANVDEIEDRYIENHNCLHPNGYNRRLNRLITVNDEIIDLNLIPIQCKFVFASNGDKCFSVGEFTQSRAYQLLTNIVAATQTDKISQKQCFKFKYFELKVSTEKDFVEGQIYDIELQYKFNDDKFVIV
jgi:hypothetical protein